jgi:hypothetical protein
MPIDFDSTSQRHNSDNNRKCSICYSETSYSEKTKWGAYEHWYGTREYPICKRCYIRKKYQEKFVPVGVKCDCCQHTKTTLSKYGTPMWRIFTNLGTEILSHSGGINGGLLDYHLLFKVIYCLIRTALQIILQPARSL